ncbi:MAG: hypothetical protein QOH60_4689 [Mycobacterium sp.]|jgi:hypothetical protein|nr:hypothetical protein [Mycobacterium sp.]
MAELDELYAQIPTDEIAGKLGVPSDEVDKAIKTLVPVLVGGLHQKAEDPEAASEVESAAMEQAASGLLDGGVSVDQVDEKAGEQTFVSLFGGDEASQVASALSGAGGGSSQLLKSLMPILVPIVLAYIGKKLTSGGAAAPAPQAQESSGGGGLGDILGGILGGKPSASAGADNPLGDILGKVLAGGQSGGLGSILGGILGGKK